MVQQLCLKTTSAEIAARLLEARAVMDISASLADVRTPTLVMHARGDEVVPVAEGRLLASAIQGAHFVELDSRNHVLLEHEPAWQRFQQEVLAFVQQDQAATNDPVFAALSGRERQVLTLMAEGLSNAEIAERLQISEKTVRNHASNIFDKLGVWSRAQAIVFARDHGYNRLTRLRASRSGGQARYFVGFALPPLAEATADKTARQAPADLPTRSRLRRRLRRTRRRGKPAG